MGAIIPAAGRFIQPEDLRTIYHAMACAMLVWDASLHIVDANAAAQAALGLSLDELQSCAPACWSSLFTQLDGAPLTPEQHPASIVLATGEAQKSVLLGLRHSRDGTLRIVHLDARPVPAGDRALTHIVATWIDITEQYQAGQRLRESEERFRTLVERAPVGACITDEHGIFHMVNTAFADCSATTPKS